MVKSLQSKIPRDFQGFLLNGDNKTRMMELIAEYIETHKAKVFNILRTNKILISLDNKCISISRLSTTVEESLKSNQEEADTKVILHCYQILKSNETSTVTLRSPSGDTDIVVLSVALLYEFRNRVILDDGSGDNRKIVRLSSLDIEKDLLDALVGFHAFTGNDYVSSFFRKGKEKCWKLVEKTKKFQNAFSMLGENSEINDDLLLMLEEYVCQLYGYRNKSTNSVRFRIYEKKYNKENKVIDMATLPPCNSVLRLHILRSNMVAALWKRSMIANIEMPDITQHGWDVNGNINWVEEVFPTDVEDILLHEEYEDLDDYLDENDGKSDNDDEDDY